MKIVVVGAGGSIGKRHIKCLSGLVKESEIVLCDVANGYLSVDDVCEEFFDLAVICTPSSTHVELATRFANCKSFFIEKPLDSDIDIAQKNVGFFKGKKTMVGCNLLFADKMAEVKEMLPKCSFASVKYHSYLPMWRENHKDLYSSRRSLGGGVFNDCVHEVHYVYHILGEPKNVVVVERQLEEHTVDTNDYCMLIFDYGDKVINIELSYLCHDKQRSCDMTFPDGSRTVVDFVPDFDTGNMQTVLDIDETYIRQWEYFLSTDAPMNSYEEALKMLDKINKSTILGDR